MTNRTACWSVQDDFRRLSAKVGKMMGEVRELPSFPDRTMVKDIMVRLTSKWSFMIQSMGSVQVSVIINSLIVMIYINYPIT